MQMQRRVSTILSEMLRHGAVKVPAKSCPMLPLVRLTPLQALRDVIAERCFGRDSPPLHGGDDAREALRDLVS
jgi:hypothetical protein